MLLRRRHGLLLRHPLLLLLLLPPSHMPLLLPPKGCSCGGGCLCPDPEVDKPRLLELSRRPWQLRWLRGRPGGPRLMSGRRRPLVL